MIKQFKGGFLLAHGSREQYPHGRKVVAVGALIVLRAQTQCRDKGLLVLSLLSHLYPVQDCSPHNDSTHI